MEKTVPSSTILAMAVAVEQEESQSTVSLLPISMVPLEVTVLGIQMMSWFQEMGKMLSQIQEPESMQSSLDEVAVLRLLL
jgi:hypothetical protein